MRKMRNVWITVLCFVLASSILVIGECENVSIGGVITAIDSGTSQITLDDETTVNAADAIITIAGKSTEKGQTVIDFEDLDPGMTVQVCGIMDGDVLVANKINVKYGGEIIE